MKRYKIRAETCYAWHRDFGGVLLVDESKTGEWVEWKDVKKLIDDKNQVIERLSKKILQVTPTLEIVRQLLLHLNKDKDGSYFLTAESYREIFKC